MALLSRSTRTVLEPAVEAEWAPRLPSAISVGRGSALWLEGGLPPEASRLRRLRLEVDGERHGLLASRMPRPETITSGDWWWATVPIEPADEDREIRVELHGTTRFLRRKVAIPLGTVGVSGSPGRGYQAELALRDPAPPIGSIMGFVELQPPVCICLPVREPNAARLQQVFEGFRSQSYANWRCVVYIESATDVTTEIESIIAGDERFELFQASRGSGAPGDVPHALELAPPEAPYVALARENDRWHPRKLEIMLAAFETSTLLAYSDTLPVVDGRPVVAPGARDADRNREGEDLGRALLGSPANGGSVVIRRELLRYALPLPPAPFAVSGVHWLTLVARVLGTVRYVDAPLSDWMVTEEDSVGRPVDGSLDGSRNWRRDYFECVVVGAVLAEVLRVRCWELMRPRDQRALHGYLKGLRGERTLRFLASGLRPTRVGNDVARRYVRGLAWCHLAKARARFVSLLPSDPGD